MKNKIKKIYYGGSAMLLMAPMAVLAQFDQSAGGDTNLSDTPIYDIIHTAMLWILSIVGILAVIGFAIAGILYLTAAGDEARVESAKKAMIYSIVGVIVALLGLIILRAVNTMLAGNTGF